MKSEHFYAILLLLGAVTPLLSQSATECNGLAALAEGSRATLEMRNGDVLQGAIASKAAGVITLNSDYGPVRIPVAAVAKVNSCAVEPLISAESIGAPAVARAPAAPKQYGLEKFTASAGFCASATRDENYSASPTFFALGANKRTLLNLSASYDDKWKAAPNSSNVTQVYSGKLQEMLLLDKPAVLVLGGNGYHNNSQGIVIDEAYDVGTAKTLAPSPTSGVEFDADLRAIYDETNHPGPTVWLAGSNLSASLSKCFPLAGEKFCGSASPSVAIKAGWIPVFNRAKSWQGYGTFDAYRPLTSTVSVGLSVVDNYFEIAPKGYNKNYAKIALSVKYTPQASKK